MITNIYNVRIHIIFNVAVERTVKTLNDWAMKRNKMVSMNDTTC